MSDKSITVPGIGYKRPPQRTRWQAGQSGNPSGRPKRAKSFDAELIDVLNEKTRMRVGNSEVEVTKLRKIVVELVESALERDAWAIGVVIAHIAKITRAAGYGEEGDSLAPDDQILREHRQAQRKGGPANVGTKNTDGPSVETEGRP